MAETENTDIDTPARRVSRPVSAGALAGALTVVLAWISGLFGLAVPAEVAAALTTILTLGTVHLVHE